MSRKTGKSLATLKVGTRDLEPASAPELSPADAAMETRAMERMGTDDLEAGLARWAQHAGLAAKVELYCQLMAGLHLVEMRRRTPEARGASDGFRGNQHTKVGKGAIISPLPDSASDQTWKDRVSDLTGYSYRTCRAWMRMAEAMLEDGRALILDEDAERILSKPLGDWTPAEEARLSESLQGATSGWKQIDFLREMGLATGADSRERRQRGKYYPELGQEPEGDEISTAYHNRPPVHEGPRKEEHPEWRRDARKEMGARWEKCLGDLNGLHQVSWHHDVTDLYPIDQVERWHGILSALADDLGALLDGHRKRMARN